MMVVLISACIQQSTQQIKSESPIRSQIFLSGDPIINQTVNITFNISSESNMSNVIARVIIQGAELVNGTLEWTGNLSKGETVQIDSTVKVLQENITVEGIVEIVPENQTANQTQPDSTTTTHPITGQAGPGKLYIGIYNETHLIKYEENGTTVIFPKPKRERTYEAPLPGGTIVPEPRKGENSTNYFKSLNLTEDFYYVMMQFEGDGWPSEKQLQILKNENITLFTPQGDFTYYAKVPKLFLQTKSYDFIRWIEIPENIIDPIRKSNVGCNNVCNITIIFYGPYDTKQIEILNKYSKIFGPADNPVDQLVNAEANSTGLAEIAKLNFVKRIEGYSTAVLA